MTTAFGDALLLEEGTMNDEEHEMTVDNYNPDYSAPLKPTPDYSHNTDHIEPVDDDPTEPSEDWSPDEIEDELRFLGLDDLLCKPVEPDVELLDAPHGDDHIP